MKILQMPSQKRTLNRIDKIQDDLNLLRNDFKQMLNLIKEFNNKMELIKQECKQKDLDLKDYIHIENDY